MKGCSMFTVSQLKRLGVYKFPLHRAFWAYFQIKMYTILLYLLLDVT